MTLYGGDIVALVTGGVLTGPIKPATPTLSVAAGTGSVIATITGDSGVTNYLKYKSGSDSAWLDGGSRSGNGNITVTGLVNNVPYIFVAYSEDDNGIVSLPSAAVAVTLAATVENKNDELLMDTANDFLAEFGETIKYLPVGGGSRTILAIIDREPPIGFGSAAGAQTTHTIISVANNSVTGISSSEINVSNDKAELAVRINETAVQKLITKIISQDAGMMKLQVR